MAQVRDGMTTDVVTVEPSATQEEKGPLPVRAIMSRSVTVVAADRDPHSVRVEEVATRDLVTAGPDQDVDEARRLMAEHQLDRLIVVEEDDHLVGIISEADIRAEEGPLA